MNLKRRTVYIVSAVACLAVALVWRPVAAQLFSARGPLQPALDLLGQVMFWSYPVRYLLFIASGVLLLKAFRAS